ncbi:unnamed protein product [Brassica oleracea var. botrytis]
MDDTREALYTTSLVSKEQIPNPHNNKLPLPANATQIPIRIPKSNSLSNMPWATLISPPAGTFSARLKSWSHGGKEMTFIGSEFLPVSSAHQGKSFVVASVRARCLPHFVIRMDGANILAVSYGSLVACQYPRQFKLPAKWSFNSHTILKSSEQVPRTPIFTEEILGGENAVGEVEPPPERSFWAKYWMYLIPLGLVVMNAVTQATNMAEEQTGGQAGGSQVQQSARRR